MGVRRVLGGARPLCLAPLHTKHAAGARWASGLGSDCCHQTLLSFPDDAHARRLPSFPPVVSRRVPAETAALARVHSGARRLMRAAGVPASASCRQEAFGRLGADLSTLNGSAVCCGERGGDGGEGWFRPLDVSL